jgi:hypothetical protein
MLGFRLLMGGPGTAARADAVFRPALEEDGSIDILVLEARHASSNAPLKSLDVCIPISIIDYAVLVDADVLGTLAAAAAAAADADDDEDDVSEYPVAARVTLMLKTTAAGKQSVFHLSVDIHRAGIYAGDQCEGMRAVHQAQNRALLGEMEFSSIESVPPRMRAELQQATRECLSSEIDRQCCRNASDAAELFFNGALRPVLAPENCIWIQEKATGGSDGRPIISFDTKTRGVFHLVPATPRPHLVSVGDRVDRIALDSARAAIVHIYGRNVRETSIHFVLHDGAVEKMDGIHFGDLTDIRGELEGYSDVFVCYTRVGNKRFRSADISAFSQLMPADVGAFHAGSLATDNPLHTAFRRLQPYALSRNSAFADAIRDTMAAPSAAIGFFDPDDEDSEHGDSDSEHSDGCDFIPMSVESGSGSGSGGEGEGGD